MPTRTPPSRPGPPDVPPIPPEARDAVLAWYDAAGRQLAFRASRDPYAILVSELMAQQTQAGRAAAAWEQWMRRFPTVEALAVATVAEVVRAWAGLGYNRRAVQLHRAAALMVERHRGRVPETLAELESLPGVGPYTARAVAAIAFGQPVGAVDTNVRRVLGRLTAGDDRPEAAAVQALADAAVPADRAGDWTHAVMDVGARFCRPRRPACADCPVVAWCRYAAGDRPPAAERSPRRPEPAFPSTRRWLRGQVLARARRAEAGRWVSFSEAMGTHPAAAVREALVALSTDGLLELRENRGQPEGRLPES